jgi:glucose/arabinose dehydrogenase
VEGDMDIKHLTICMCAYMLMYPIGARAQAGIPPDTGAMNLEPIMAPGDHPVGKPAPIEDRPVGAILETRPKINPAVSPAFKAQTDAPSVKSRTQFNETVVARGFVHAWGLAFLPDGRMIVSERPGALRIVSQDGKVSDPIANIPKEVINHSDSGFYDIVVDPDFTTTRRLFFSYVEWRGMGIGNGLTVCSATLSTDERSLDNIKKLLVQAPHNDIGHYGGRLLITPDHKLLIGVGDHFVPEERIKAQDLDSLNGKIARINLDGTIPDDNPFAHVLGAEGAIWALGLRNVEGMSYDGKGLLWASEIGPQTADEINIIERGHNYGWPIVDYGTEYSGKLINGGLTRWPGTDQPVYYWDPTIAPSGIAFYSGDLFSEWKGNLFVAALAGSYLSRLVIRDRRIVGEERLLQDVHRRIRDVKQGPDGGLWVLTDAQDSSLIHLTPR